MMNKDHSSVDNRIGNMKLVKMETNYMHHELGLLESKFYEHPADTFRLMT